MISRIKKKYISAVMLSVVSVLGVIITLINTANYISVNERSEIRLDFIAKNDNLFPDRPQTPSEDESEDGGQEKEDEESAIIDEETPFDTRYFTVSLGNDGKAIDIYTDRVARVTGTNAVFYATNAFEKNSLGGYVDDYKYRAIEHEEKIVYIFLDATRELTAFRAFLAWSIIISIVGTAVIFLLVVILANRIFAPIIESYEKQRRFITDAGHELKTPLAIIEANAEVIEMTSGESEWTESIKKQTKRMTHLTENLVYLSRMEESGNSATHETFSLGDIVDEVAESWLAVAETKGKTLSFAAMPNVIVRGSKNDLAQLVSILIDNAIKYSAPDGKIILTLENTPLGAELICQNDVEDIEIGSLNVLFNRFYRRDSSRNSNGGGFGIGLSLAKSIVQNHGGKISARSDDGKSIIISALFPKEQQ